MTGINNMCDCYQFANNAGIAPVAPNIAHPALYVYFRTLTFLNLSKG